MTAMLPDLGNRIVGKINQVPDAFEVKSVEDGREGNTDLT